MQWACSRTSRATDATATSASTERMFSAARNMTSRLKTRTAGDRFERQTILRAALGRRILTVERVDAIAELLLSLTYGDGTWSIGGLCDDGEARVGDHARNSGDESDDLSSGSIYDVDSDSEDGTDDSFGPHAAAAQFFLVD